MGRARNYATRFGGMRTVNLYDRRPYIDGFMAAAKRQEHGYASGAALERHIKSAHNGIVSAICLGCQQLLQRQLAAQGATA